MAAFEFALECERRFQKVKAADTVWNFGAIQFTPGVANVVPKEASLTVEVRDISETILRNLQTELETLAAERDGARKVGVKLQRQGALAPAMMDARLCTALQRAADAHQCKSMTLPSGAIHDAMVMARHLPTGMLFVPSIGGRSHTPVENTSEHHIMLGAKVFFDALQDIAKTFQIA